MKAAFCAARGRGKSRFLFGDDAVEYDPAAVEKVLKKNNGDGLMSSTCAIFLNTSPIGRRLI